MMLKKRVVVFQASLKSVRERDGVQLSNKIINIWHPLDQNVHVNGDAANKNDTLT